MKEQLIDFPTAKLAKEKGFNKTSHGKAYLKDGTLGYTHAESSDSIIIYKEQYGSPTQSLLQKWLRDEHRIHITIRHYTDCPTRRFDDFDYDDELGSYGIEIHEPKTQDECDIYVNSDFLGETYEEVLEIALKEGLKLIN